MKFDGNDETGLEQGLAAAQAALNAGQLAVMPTDTVYGLAADAFSPAAVQGLLDAKARTRQMPPPVLIGNAQALDALVEQVPAWLRTMLDDLWPGPLTVVCRQQQSLQWDLGETHQTVAVRMPNDPIALALLRRTGPLAVSSANKTGMEAARTVDEAENMLGESVAVYLDGGPSGTSAVSTILDITGSTPRILRTGAVDLETLHRYNNTIQAEQDSTGSGGASSA